MNKLTSIRIKQNDGTYSDDIPVQVLADNVVWTEGSTVSLTDILGQVKYTTKGSIQHQLDTFSLDEVENARVGADDTQYQNLKARLDGEYEDLQDAIAAVATNLQTQTGARSNADTAIRTDLNSEIASRINGDNILSGQITSLSSDIDNLENRIDWFVTPQMYGAKADGITDDTDAIQDAIDSNPRKVIYFPDGEYLISSPITTSSNTAYCVDLVLSRFAKIIADSSWEDETECMIKLCDSGNSVNVYEPYHSRGITGGVIDCNRVASGISIEYGREQFIRNINIKNVKKYGIHIKRNSVHASNDSDISDIYLQGYEGQENTAIFLEGSDNTITNLRTNGFRYGVDVASNGNIFKNVHPFYTTFEGGYNYESIAFIVRGYENRFETCYSDQYQVGFDFRNSNGTCTDCMVTWWSNNQAIQTAVRSSVPLAAVFNGLWVSFTTGSQNTILDCPTTSYGAGALYNLRVTGTKTVTGADYYYTKNAKANEYKIVTITGINSNYYVINNFKSTYNINSNYTIAGIIIRESSGVGNGLITIEYHETNDTLAIKIERQILRTTKTISSINSNAYIYSNFSSLVGANTPYDIVAINVEGTAGYSAMPVAVEYDLTSDKAVFKSTVAPTNGTVKLNVSYKNTITNGGVGLYLLLQH